jgi:hypothetical protein
MLALLAGTACKGLAQTGEVSVIDAFHENASEAVFDAAEGIDRFIEKKLTTPEERSSDLLDRFYGPRHVDDQGNESHVRVSPQVEIDEDGFEYDVKFDVRLKLPRSGSRLQVIANNLAEDDVPLQDFRTLREEEAEDRDEGRDGIAGLRFLLIEKMESRVSLDTGLKFEPEPVPRIRLRGLLGWKLGPYEIEPSQSLFWQSDDGFGERTQLRVIRVLSSRTVVRSTTAATWSETSDGVELGQSFGGYTLWNPRTVLFAKAGISGHDSSSTTVDKYAVRVGWRRRLQRDWLTFAVEPGLEFRREDGFDAAPLIGFELQGRFGRSDPGP